MAYTVAFITALVLIIPGIFMAFIPLLPALSYMFVIALVFGIYDSFTALTLTELFILLGIVIVSIVIDHTSGLIGAKYGGAHTKSLLWGIAGAFVGTFFLAPLGSFIGLFLGVLLAEFHYKKASEGAFKAAGSALLGTVAGVAANIILAIAFTVTFFFFALP
jgi:uncharacterized protein YqgC (DUF456 family)